MKPFLILQLRANDAAAQGEFDAFLRYGGLTSDQVVRIRMESDELPEIDLDAYSGVIVGGGPWNVSDSEEKKSERQKLAEAWLTDLITQIIAKDMPYLGACYGLGSLNRAAGATVSKDQYGEPVSAVTIDLTDEGQKDPLLDGFPTSFRAIVGHKEACQNLPEGAVHLASSSTCPLQMYRIGSNVYATQFHPELDLEGIHVRIDVYKHAGYFPPEDAEDLKKTFEGEEITVPTQLLKRFVEKYKTTD